MLPPQLQQSSQRLLRHSSALALRGTFRAVIRPIGAHVVCRSFWWHRAIDWASPADPVYHRFHRIRTLKTRAKLLEKIRRRGKFEWDINQNSFFTSKQLRWASHWNDGSGRRRWLMNEEPEKKKDQVKRAGEEEGYELSNREKIWKEQMERLRKRIEHDPYEAIFGKRFEPFWSPLVPSWMREEMGLQGWPKSKEQPKTTRDRSETSSPEEAAATNATAEHPSPKQEVHPTVTPTSEPTSYSYASTTSWNSLTNEAKRVEWDSVSKKTKEYIYDPISNRMVEIKPLESTKSIRSNDIANAADTTIPANDQSLERQPKELRDSTEDVPPSPQLSHSIPLTQGVPTSLGPVKTTAVSSSSSTKPAALARLPERDLDLLTADDVRASMGKVKLSIDSAKPLTPEEKVQLERDFDEKANARDKELDAILQERDSTKAAMAPKCEWDQAEMGYMLDRELETLLKKKEKLIKSEHGVFHIERLSHELQKLDNRIKEVTVQVDRLNMLRLQAKPSIRELAEQLVETKTHEKPIDANSSPKPLQPSLDRLQSKDLSENIDLDDSAAHESTEPLEHAAGVPKEWSKQAEMLQADRVHRTTGKSIYPVKRWIDDMEARKAKYEAEQDRLKAIVAERDAERNAKATKANAMLQAEIADQKLRMTVHETRGLQHIASPGSPTETAGEAHSEKHLERIQNLEQALGKAQNIATESQEAIEKSRKAYADKLNGLRSELEIAYKQSTAHAEEHLDRIRFLERELEKAKRKLSEQTLSAGAMKVVQATGDFDSDVTNFIDRNNWYKQPAKAVSQHTSGPIAESIQKLQDRALVKEVREIYEHRYGVIDASHRQDPTEARKVADLNSVALKKPRQVVEVECDVDLGEELAKFEKEKEQRYQFRADNLANEIAAEEREAHEAQALMAPENSAKMRQVIADPFESSSAVVGETKSAGKTAAGPAIEWQDPPVYKVLAYDSGNDILSSATTTSNFTSSETPISIQQALAQLYQPARFVPLFADLQQEGYQVIYGTKDLLVFKKVKSIQSVSELNEVTKPVPTLVDHGLVNSQDQYLFQEPAAPRKTDVNPIDGTQASPATGNFASPTGFVNHDPVLPQERIDATEKGKGVAAGTDREISGNWRSSQRIRRQEPHFTGTTTATCSPETVKSLSAAPEGAQTRYWNAVHRRHARAEERRQPRRTKHERRRGRFSWILKTSLGVAGVMYLIGAAAERSRDRERREKEDWASRAEEVRKRMNGGP